jgi:protein-tyrosine phosphatase
MENSGKSICTKLQRKKKGHLELLNKNELTRTDCCNTGNLLDIKSIKNCITQNGENNAETTNSNSPVLNRTPGMSVYPNLAQQQENSSHFQNTEKRTRPLHLAEALGHPDSLLPEETNKLRHCSLNSLKLNTLELRKNIKFGGAM